MILLGELSRSLAGAVKQLWPEVSVSTNFSPLVDLSLGDVSSDVPIRLAAVLNRNPEDICRELLQAWDKPQGVSVQLLRGYVNLRFLDSHSNLTADIISEAYDGDGLMVIVPPRCSGASKLSQLRLGCTALAQVTIAHHLAIPAQLYCGARRVDLTLPGGLAAAVRFVIDDINAASESRLTGSAHRVVGDLLRAGPAQAFVWLLQNTLAKGEFVSICAASKARLQDLYMISSPAPWLDFRFHDDGLRDLLTWDDGELRCLVWYLAQQIPAADIDFATPRLQEQANVLWHLRSTQERAMRLLADLPAAVSNYQGQDNVEVNKLQGMFRHLGIRLRYSGLFQQAAVLQAKVPEYMSVLADTLAVFSSIFNSPDFRGRKDIGHLCPWESEILAGAVRFLSDSITLCEPF